MADWIDGPPPGADHHGRFPVGVLLQVKDETQGAGGLVLVGHQNNLGGLCDDCSSGIGPADVVRHRFVWREPTEGKPRGLTPAELDALPAEAVVLTTEGENMHGAWQKQDDTGRWGSYDAGTATSAELVEWWSPVRRMVVEGEGD